MRDVGAEDGLHEAMLRHSEDRWRDAILAAEIFAVGGHDLGGLWLTARAGGVRDRFLDHLRSLMRDSIPFLRLPVGASASMLCGHLDLAATMRQGRLVWDRGILAAANNGVIIVPMAERLEAATAAIIAEAMDTGFCPNLRVTRDNDAPVRASFAIVALDEAAEPEERPPSALTDRLGLHVNLDGITWQTVSDTPLTEGISRACDWRAVTTSDDLAGQLSVIAASAGHASLRTLLHLLKTSRILAAKAGRNEVNANDGLVALRLCLGIRLVESEGRSEIEPPGSERTPGQAAGSVDSTAPHEAEREPPAAALDSLTEVLAAVERGTIEGLSLASVARPTRNGNRAGKAGSRSKNARRGRPYGESRNQPYPDARPDIVGTLRAAAPWQVIRAHLLNQGSRHEDGAELKDAGLPRRLMIRKEDFRYRRRQHHNPSTAIFVVDASGSTALERLGETKGAIEQLLARCYIRRDEVALIAFRGTSADIVMPPTRSLVAAKRKLAALPGGGPTPLASGLEKGLGLALAERRRGNTPVLVVMTDGSGNVALDGTPDRLLASRQTGHLAGLCRTEGITSICIDIARRPRESVTLLAGQLGAELHILRQADSARMSGLVNASMEAART
ncbi:VWA domain-containing protein [Ciceribacter sp. L1K23]|uniref:VWA domain-containing protein n=1 Tax=Ciceribacter sp. L1K23 TaxID=2820276 RepID=UPI001B81B1EE|nr:VWA domain-containing protein [Ciceribacter sp. L1K23]MBR0558328.1 VWA domain-containing protein [Ciceribacter sp. L1K23]